MVPGRVLSRLPWWTRDAPAPTRRMSGSWRMWQRTSHREEVPPLGGAVSDPKSVVLRPRDSRDEYDNGKRRGKRRSATFVFFYGQVKTCKSNRPAQTQTTCEPWSTIAALLTLKKWGDQTRGLGVLSWVLTRRGLNSHSRPGLWVLQEAGQGGAGGQMMHARSHCKVTRLQGRQSLLGAGGEMHSLSHKTFTFPQSIRKYRPNPPICHQLLNVSSQTSLKGEALLLERPEDTGFVSFRRPHPTHLPSSRRLKQVVQG